MNRPGATATTNSVWDSLWSDPISQELAKIESDVQAVSRLANRLFGPTANELGEIAGDWARSWRLRNLLAIQKRLEKRLQAKGVDYGDLRHLSLSVGLPMLERASYQDDSFLQKKWANLMAASLHSGRAGDDFNLEMTYVEILSQMARLDCEILEYVCEQGVDHQDEQGYIEIAALDPAELEAEFSGRLAHLSLEKLCSLGALRRAPKLPLKSGGSVGLQEIIAPTLVGINLYVASSGQTPEWMKTKGTGDPNAVP